MATDSLPIIRITCDIGNGRSVLFWRDYMGMSHLHSTATIRSNVAGLSIGLKAMEQQYTWYEWNGEKYVVGDDAIMYARKGIERHMGEHRYGSDLQWFMVAVLLAQQGFKEGNFHLTLFAPPGRFADAEKAILASAKKHKKLTIKVKGDHEPRTFHINKVTVQSETVAALGVLMFTPEGKPINWGSDDPLRGTVYLEDGGVETFDTIVVTNGRISNEDLQFATEPKGGIDARIRVPLLTKLHSTENPPSYKNITVDDIDYVMRNPRKSEEHFKTITGDELDIAPVLEKMYENNYYRWLRANLIDTRFDGYRGASAVAFFGGGGIITKPFWNKDFKKLALDLPQYVRDYPGLEKATLADLNAVGGYLLYPVFG